MKKITKPIVVLSSFAMIAGLAACSNQSTNRWAYAREDMGEFVKVKGIVETLDNGHKLFSVNYAEALLSSELAKENILVYSIDAASGKMVSDHKKYADYDVLNSAKLDIYKLETSEDKSDFSIEFSPAETGKVGILVNKEIVAGGSFLLGEEYEAEDDLEDDPTAEWSEKYASDAGSWSSVGKPFIQVLANIGAIIAGAATDNPVSIVSGAFGIITALGDAFGSSGPTIADVLNKLKEIDSKIDDLGRKMEINHEQLLVETVRTQAMVDSVLLNQCESAITDFSTNYLKPIDTFNRNLSDILGDFYKDYVKSPKTIDLYCYKGSDGNWAYAPLTEMDGKTPNVSLVINDFAHAKEFLAQNENIVKNGFIDALSQDIKDYAKTHYPEIDETFIGVAGVSMINDYELKDYFAENKEEAKNLRNIVIDLSKRFNGSYGTTIISSFISRLNLMFNFTGETYPYVRDIVANLKSYLDFNAARALEACVFAQIDDSELFTVYKAARQNMTDAFNNVKGLGQNYSFTAGCALTANMYNAKYSTYYTNPGNSCVLHTSFALTQYTLGENQGINSKLTEFKDHSFLGETDHMRLATRYNMVKSFEEKTAELDYTNYIATYVQGMSDALTIYKAYTNAKFCGSEAYRFFTGCFQRNMNSTDVNKLLTCQAKGNPDGDYFGVGYKYYYSHLKDSSCWYGEILETTYIDGKTGSATGTGTVAAWARYAESHWYWIDDEYASFVDNVSGNYFFMLEQAKAA